MELASKVFHHWHKACAYAFILERDVFFLQITKRVHALV